MKFSTNFISLLAIMLRLTFNQQINLLLVKLYTILITNWKVFKVICRQYFHIFLVTR